MEFKKFSNRRKKNIASIFIILGLYLVTCNQFTTLTVQLKRSVYHQLQTKCYKTIFRWTRIPQPDIFRCHKLKQHSVTEAYLMESLGGQAGTDGLRTTGHWEEGSKGGEREGPPSLLPTPNIYHQPPTSIPPNHFQHSDSYL